MRAVHFSLTLDRQNASLIDTIEREKRFNLQVGISGEL